MGIQRSRQEIIDRLKKVIEGEQSLYNIINNQEVTVTYGNILLVAVNIHDNQEMYNFQNVM